MVICTLEESIIVLSHGFLSLLGHSFIPMDDSNIFLTDYLGVWAQQFETKLVVKVRKVVGWGWVFLLHISSLFKSAEM